MSKNLVKIEFEKMTDLIDDLKEIIGNRSIRTVYSKGPYFEVPIFSYQRSRMNQGKIISNSNKIKSFDEVYRYQFDEKNRIIYIGVGNEFDEFTEDYILYEDNFFIVYSYDEEGEPLSASRYQLLNGKLTLSTSYGLHGSNEEKYGYVGDTLQNVKSCSQNHGENEMTCNTEIFHYSEDLLLSKIEIKYASGDTEIIYKKK